MKWGILLNKDNLNVGDDIQAYATARFLPHVDYLVDREHLDSFRSDDGEPVAVIMNAWYMWRKWNWPPSKYIVPLMIGFHYADHQLAKQPGSPIKYEFLEGAGGQYLKDYGPVGCRDYFTRDKLQAMGIESYFSGCITMTLPEMPKTKDRGSYICLVDLEKKATNKMKSVLANKEIEVREISHNKKRDIGLPWQEREKWVIELLTEYANARCVVTKRLHCALPCLALGVPVFVIKEMENDIRWDPYYDFLHRTTVTKFIKDEYEYDFMNPPANKKEYKSYREKLIQDVKKFVRETDNQGRNVDELNKLTCSPQEILEWRHDVMKNAMDLWYIKHRDLQNRVTKMNREMKTLKNNTQKESSLIWLAKKLNRKLRKR